MFFVIGQGLSRLQAFMALYIALGFAVLVVARAFLAPAVHPETARLGFGLTCLALLVTARPVCRRLLVLLPGPAGREPAPAATLLVEEIGDDVDLATAVEASRRGDWRPAAALLAASQDVDVRSDRMDVLAEAAVTDGQWVEEWLAAAPQDPGVAVVRARVAVNRAWAARGGHYAAHTSADQFRAFHTGLTVAERLAERAVALAPGDPEPWVALVQLAKGQEAPREEFERRVRGLFDRAPHHVIGSRAALQAVCPKWMGSTEVMFSVARNLAAQAPAGSAVNLLPVQAHVEHHLELLRGQDGEHRARRHMRSDETRQELRAAVRRWVAGPHGGPMPGGGLHGHNLAAYAFWLAGDADAARPHLEAVGRSVTRSPWAYTDEPGVALTRAREWAGLPVPAAPTRSRTGQVAA